MSGVKTDRTLRPAGPGEVQVARALLSVSDKTGIVEFARGLADLGIEIISTGGTARELGAAGIPVRTITDLTGFPGDHGRPRQDAASEAVRRTARGPLESRSRRGRAGARGRAGRPRLREPLPVRADRGPARGVRRRGDREHRHRRADDDQGGGQEPGLRGPGRLARELRRGAGRAARERPAALAADAREPGRRGVLLHGPLRHRDRALVPGAQRGLPAADGARVRAGARASLRRESAPARRVLRAGRGAHPRAVDGRPARWQGAVVQQPARPRLRPGCCSASSRSRPA